MFRQAAKFIRHNAKRLMLASSLTAFTLLSHNIRTQSHPQINLQDLQLQTQKLQQQHKALSKIIEVDVCEAKALRQGQPLYFEVQQQFPDGSVKPFPILVFRYKGKLYCVSGQCTYTEPLSEGDAPMKDAIVFNDKLYCPHHGCAFNITSGSVEYGPAYYQLPKFFVREKQGKITVFYPSKIPKKVLPKTQPRDYNDLRKVMILGGDHHAVMGCIYGLRQYDFGGQITLVQSEVDEPYRHEQLHKTLINLKDKKKTEEEIEKVLEKQVYEKLKFQTRDWFDEHGIEFMYSSDMYRIINKRYYPYLSFLDQTKAQFDGLVIAQGVHESEAPIKNLQKLPTGISSPNVFSPFKNKNQHTKLIKYLNMNPVKNLMVVGLNPESLQFCDAVLKQFPQIRINVMDMEKENKFSEMYGPYIAQAILNEFKSKGVDFYVKILKKPNAINRINIQDRQFKPNTISVQLDADNHLKADAAVMFSNQFVGNNKCIHQGKYTDIDFTRFSDRVIGDMYCRTDTKRIFTIGSGSSNNYFFTGLKLQSNNPNVALEQGYTAAFNLLALKIPYHYIPFETQSYLGKKILYSGSRIPFESMYILGSVQNWDFIAFYALNDMIVGTSASPSRQRQFQVVREAFRLNIMPDLPEFIEGTTNIAELYLSVKKSDKSACYKDEIHNLDDSENAIDALWMERERASMATKESSVAESESPVEVDSKGYIREI